MLEQIQLFDWKVLAWIQDVFCCDFMDFIMPKITALRNAGIIWILAGIALLFSKKYRKSGIFLLVGLLLGLLTGNLILKNLVARARPCWLDPLFPLLIENPEDYSFPSGHTLSSVIAAVSLAKTDRRFGYIAVPLAVLIAFSRLYLYVHFPTDVLAAAVLGIGIAFLTFYVGNKVFEKTLQDRT